MIVKSLFWSWKNARPKPDSPITTAALAKPNLEILVVFKDFYIIEELFNYYLLEAKFVVLYEHSGV